MRYPFAKTPLELLRAMVETAAMMRCLDSIKRKPGDQVARLSPEERELLKGLKAEDTLRDRVPYY